MYRKIARKLLFPILIGVTTLSYSDVANNKFTEEKNKKNQQLQTVTAVPISTYQHQDNKKPVLINGEIITHKSDEDSERDKEESNKRSISDQKSIFLSEINIFLTAVLVLVGVVQAGLFIWQLKLIRRSLFDTRRAARAAVKQANAAIKTVNVIERPWLFIEKVHVIRREVAPINPNLINNWEISFICRNFGGSPALIKECVIKYQDKDTLSNIPDYAGAIPVGLPQAIAAGGEFETSPAIGPSRGFGEKDGKPILFVVYGKLTYTDLGGIEHCTGFAVAVSPNIPAYNTYENKEYEYHS